MTEPTITPTKFQQYFRALERVKASPALLHHRRVLLDYDWAEPEHFDWVATAPEDKLIAWAETIHDPA